MDTIEPTTEYRPIPNSPGYRVGSDGSVWSCKPPHPRAVTSAWHRLATKVNVNGYEAVGLWQDGRRKLRLVQALVLESFVGLRPEGMWALHRNDNPLDNRLANLYWGTHTENIQDAKRNNRLRRGMAHPQARLSDSDVECLRERYAQGESQRALARAFDISQQNVSQLVNGSRRVDASRADGNDRPKASSTLSPDDVRRIRYLCGQGSTHVAVARLFGISHATVRGIIHGRRHKDVTG